jgi:hypothetical protein
MLNARADAIAPGLALKSSDCRLDVDEHKRLQLRGIAIS